MARRRAAKIGGDRQHRGALGFPAEAADAHLTGHDIDHPGRSPGHAPPVAAAE
ncbi:MAG: hypothetical protein R3E68_01600 [Burkholderiaceae bacterium]